MAVADIASGALSEDVHRSQLRRAIIASTVGTTIEWYDFLLYGIVTGLVFGKLFFPKSDPLVGVLEAFSIFAIGFIARPFGAAIFGHFGDRVGRKAVLITTLLITGFATFAVGLVPTYDMIGIWGAVILTAIRFIQGIGLGGEWGGSVLLGTCSCNWLAALTARSACSLPNRAPFDLPRLSRPNKTSGAGPVLVGEWLAFAVMIGTPWNQKGTRSGSLGFTGYGSFDSGSERWPSRLSTQ
jgi:MFS family permease